MHVHAGIATAEYVYYEHPSVCFLFNPLSWW